MFVFLEISHIIVTTLFIIVTEFVCCKMCYCHGKSSYLNLLNLDYFLFIVNVTAKSKVLFISLLYII